MEREKIIRLLQSTCTDDIRIGMSFLKDYSLENLKSWVRDPDISSLQDGIWIRTNVKGDLAIRISKKLYCHFNNGLFLYDVPWYGIAYTSI